MIIVLKREATQEDADEILGRIEERGLKPLYMAGTERVVLGALGDAVVLVKQIAVGDADAAFDRRGRGVGDDGDLIVVPRP